MSSVFSKIIDGEIPAFVLEQDDHFIAFLDIAPVAAGHTLIVPKKEIDYLFDIDDDLISSMIIFAKKVAKALKLSFPCNRIGLTVIGLEVPHAHMHLIPITHESDMSFSKPRLKFSGQELETFQTKIIEVLETLSK